MAIRIIRVPSRLKAAKTVERYLLEDSELTPRKQIKQALLAGKVLLNKRAVSRSHLLRGGETIEIHSDLIFSQDEVVVSPNPSLSLNVLFETPHLIVVNKPGGQNAHPLRPDERDTTLNALAARFPESSTAVDPSKPLEGGLVHRLDRGTSGILVCARSLRAWRELKEIWKSRQIEKVYVAWLEGEMTQKGQITCFLTHDPKSKKRMKVYGQKPEGLTSWKAVTSVEPAQIRAGRTLALIRIHTGVTHQIRATTAALGHAVVSDPVYKSASRSISGLRFKPLDADTKRLFAELKKTLRAGTTISTPLPNSAFFLHALWLRAEGDLDRGISAPIPWNS